MPRLGASLVLTRSLDVARLASATAVMHVRVDDTEVTKYETPQLVTWLSQL